MSGITIAIFMLIIHLLSFVSIGLNIPILRQFFGFIYIAFIPGFVIVRVLRIKEKNIIDTLLFSVSLSIAFLMFTGLLMNELYPQFGVLRPLSTVPLTITITSLTLAIFFVDYRKDLARSLNAHAHFVAGLSIRNIVFHALLILLPLISAVGALYVNTFLLLLMIIGIAALYATSIFSETLVPPKLYPFVVFAISISLLFQTSLISKHIMGWDIYAEYHVFKLTETVGRWDAPGVVLTSSVTDIMNSVLTTTILPTTYSAVLNLDGELIFKIVYPFIFSLVPLLLYRIYEFQSRKLVALLSTFYFISNPLSFYGLETLSLARQMIATLFFVASIFSLTHRNMTPRNKRILFMIFSAALVVSHYSVSFIYLFYVISIFILSYIRGNRKSLDLALVLFVIAITFSWYVYVSNPPLNRLIDVFHDIIDRFIVDIFEPEARLPARYASLSPLVQTSIIGWVHKILVYITQFFIIIGTVVLTIKPKEFKFNPEFRLMAVLSAFILLLCLGVPNLATAWGFSRFYQIIMVFLAPLFVLGGMYLLRLIEKFASPFLRRFTKVSCRDLELRIVTVVLIAFFLFQVGFVNHVTGGYPYSYSLGFNRKKASTNPSIVIEFYHVYVSERDVFSARWLSKNMNKTLVVYADLAPYYHILPAYALLPFTQINDLHKNMTLTQSSYIYLSNLNVQKGVIIPRASAAMSFNISEISDFFNKNDKIYSNGGSDVYYAP